MAWWRRNPERAGGDKGDKVRFPVCLELIPEELTARVYMHQVASRHGPVPCWTYVTDGLWSHRQKELVFSLRRHRRERADDYPDHPLRFFTQIYHLAGDGQLVDAGGFTEVASKSFLGHKALAYMHPQPFDDFDLPSPSLAAILLKEEELEAVKAFGLTRVMARLGYAYRHYPYPPWSDRRRRPLPFGKAMRQSVLMRVARVWAPGVRVSQVGGQVVLHLLPEAVKHLRGHLSQIPASMPLALLAELDPAADGCLVSEPAQSGPLAITPPDSSGSHLAGCFVAFVPEQAEDSGQIFEDGFTVMLTDASMTAVRNALMTREAVSVPATGQGMDLILEWTE